MNSIENAFASAIYVVGLVLMGGACTQPQKMAEQEGKTSTSTPAEARPTHWSYDAEDGPSVWATLDPVYALCGEGTAQSPINLAHSEEAQDPRFSLRYGTTGIHMVFNEHVQELVDNGHTIQLNVEEGSQIDIDGESFELKQFHFHTPSEHTMDGEHFPLEVHFVHQNTAGKFAVLGVLVAEGEQNKNIGHLIENLPQTKGDTVRVDEADLDLNVHLPENSDAFIYTGSLTTPPCSEDVHWLVLKEHPEMSREQIDAIASIIGPNNRPVQQLNGRGITSSAIAEDAPQ